MGVDIADLFRPHIGIFERHLHAASRSNASRHEGDGHVVGIAGHAIAHNFSVDGAPAAEGMLQVLPEIKMPQPSPITKPSRSLSKGRLAWAGSSFRVERARAPQTRQRQGRHRSFGAAADHGLGIAVLHQPEGIADGI